MTRGVDLKNITVLLIAAILAFIVRSTPLAQAPKEAHVAVDRIADVWVAKTEQLVGRLATSRGSPAERSR